MYSLAFLKNKISKQILKTVGSSKLRVLVLFVLVHSRGVFRTQSNIYDGAFYDNI